MGTWAESGEHGYGGDEAYVTPGGQDTPKDGKTYYRYQDDAKAADNNQEGFEKYVDQVREVYHQKKHEKLREEDTNKLLDHGLEFGGHPEATLAGAAQKMMGAMKDPGHARHWLSEAGKAAGKPRDLSHEETDREDQESQIRADVKKAVRVAAEQNIKNATIRSPQGKEAASMLEAGLGPEAGRMLVELDRAIMADPDRGSAQAAAVANAAREQIIGQELARQQVEHFARQTGALNDPDVRATMSHNLNAGRYNRLPPDQVLAVARKEAEDYWRAERQRQKGIRPTEQVDDHVRQAIEMLRHNNPHLQSR